MSWPLATMLILGIALGIGFAWYERTRPSARVLALVAALAALAVVGRLAFAAFPNVKPTTDIVLFAGYALGGAPGFAVGALTALTSNVFLTQGPWTPWQMAAWGGVGVAGAGLARLRPEPSRWTLALVCGIAGFAFGAVMDVYQWSYGAEQTLASYLAISATSFPYNLAHALGNVIFALAIGPAFLRALRRYRLRFDVRWALAPASVVLLLLVLAAPAGASVPVLDRAARYLESAQNADGGFGPAPRQSSTQLHTGWTALGLGAVRRNPRDVERGGRSAIDYLRTGSGGLRDVGEIERTILVLRAGGVSARSFAGRDLLAELVAEARRRLVARTGRHGAWGILALRAAASASAAARLGSARPRSDVATSGFRLSPSWGSDARPGRGRRSRPWSSGAGGGVTAGDGVGPAARAEARQRLRHGARPQLDSPGGRPAPVPGWWRRRGWEVVDRALGPPGAPAPRRVDRPPQPLRPDPVSVTAQALLALRRRPVSAPPTCPGRSSTRCRGRWGCREHGSRRGGVGAGGRPSACWECSARGQRPGPAPSRGRLPGVLRGAPSEAGNQGPRRARRGRWSTS